MNQANLFTGTKGTRSPRIMIVGESYGETEVARGMPFVGQSGQDLDKLLGEAGIPFNICFFTNVVNERPPANDMSRFFYTSKEAKELKLTPLRGLYPKPNVIAGLEKLRALISLLKPELIIGFGNYTLWALTDDSFSIGNKAGSKVPTGIGQWRGSQLYTSDEYNHTRFLPTYHPAAGLRVYPWRDLIKHDLKARAHKALEGNWDEAPVKFTIRPSFGTVTQFLQDTLCQLSSGPLRIAIDTETRNEGIACCGFALNETEAICIPFQQVGYAKPSYWSLAEEIFIVSQIRQILEHPNCELEGQNLLYDVQYFFHDWFTKPTIDFDSMIAHHLCFPGGGDPNSAKATLLGIQQKALYHLSSLYCEYHRYWKDEGKNWSESFGEEQLWSYNCRDCIKTFECCTQLRKLVSDFDLEAQHTQQLRIANEMLLPMMLRGVRRDDLARRNDGFLLKAAEMDFDHYLENFLPERISSELDAIVKSKKSAPWYASAKKLSHLCYEILGVKPIKNKAGNPTTGKDALPIIAEREPFLKPILDRVELRRSLGVYYSTFIEMEDDDDGRSRSSYKITGTDTFRLASSENAFGHGGNLQNIPSGRDTAIELNFKFPNIRSQFIPDIGYELAEFDLSGADAQIVAWEAEDDDLKAAFRAGLKLHVKNTRDAYPDITENMTDDEIKEYKAGKTYRDVKAMVHATNFGGTSHGLATKLHMPVKAVDEFQERWFHLHPGIRTWHQKTQQKLQGYRCWKCEGLTEHAPICPHCNAYPQGRVIGNRFGYRVIFFDRVQELFTNALAWTPQSTTAINCNKGALALIDRVPWCQLLMQVHDSLVVQYPIGKSDCLPDIHAALHSVTVPYADPLTIPWSCKISRRSWGEAKEIKW